MFHPCDRYGVECIYYQEGKGHDEYCSQCNAYDTYIPGVDKGRLYRCSSFHDIPENFLKAGTENLEETIYTRQMLKFLPGRIREIIERRIAGQTWNSIGKVVGMRRDNVKRAFNRAIRRIAHGKEASIPRQ